MFRVLTVSVSLAVALAAMLAPITAQAARKMPLVIDNDFCIDVMSSMESPVRLLTAEIIREYRKAGGATKNENLKHVRRMVSVVNDNWQEIQKLGINSQELIASIYISDVAKSPHIINKYKDSHFQGNGFAAFMEHSLISMLEAQALRTELGVSDEAWQRIVNGVIGHDGPSVEGTWWKENYEAQLKKEYAGINSPQGVLHAYLDRMDQGGLYRLGNGSLEGGLRKISYEISKRGDTKSLETTILYLFGSVHKLTLPQLNYLDTVLIPQFFPGQSTPAFFKKLRENFDQTTSYMKYVGFTKDPNKVIIKDPAGEGVVVTNLDDFWHYLELVSRPLSPVSR
jgi:hypothetical protein